MSYRDIGYRKHGLLKGGISMNRYLMLKVWLLALLIAVPVSAQEARYGAGVFFNRSVPVLGFSRAVFGFSGLWCGAGLSGQFTRYDGV